MRGLARFVLSAAIFVAWTGLSAGPATGQCAGPSLDIAGARHTARGIPTIRGGSTVTVVGTDWFGGCNDSVTGCFQHAGQVDPIQGATISIAAARRRPRDERAWKPEGTASVIGTADADEHGNLSLTNVAMPSEAGTYVLITDMPYPSYFPVRIT